MGLNALVTRSVAGLVRSLALQGKWKEHDVHEFSSAGRIPDDAMMLNIAVRAAIDRCTALESFKWELNTKIYSNVYSGLANVSHLRNLHIRFPMNRSPRPVATIPGMPDLRSFTVTHIDPLCFPDDISMLIYASKKLDTLKMHWSPRMRDAVEPSVHLQTYFRRNMAAREKIYLKEFGIYNLFALMSEELEDVIDDVALERFTLLNCFGDDDGNIGSPATFFDSSWVRGTKDKDNTHLLSIRHDRISKQFVSRLGLMHGLEKMYFVNSRHVPAIQNGHQNSNPSPQSTPVASTSASSETSSTSRSAASHSNPLRNLCIDLLISNHGSTLRHLILPDRWPLPNQLTARLIRACPNLTQLALALEFSSFDGMRMLLPFLKDLRAVRVLMPTGGGEETRFKFETMVETDDDVHEMHLGRETSGDDFPHLRYVGLGWKVWELGTQYLEKLVNADGDESTALRRRCRRVNREAVREVEIWRMDSLDVI